MIRTLLLACVLLAPFSALAQPSALDGVADDRIVAISDGDFLAETYGTQVLPPVSAGHRDTLTVFSRVDGRWVRAALSVSNSVTAAPEILALTPDGRTAFVTERLGERPPGGTMVSDLPPGNRLFAIDLSRADAPRLAATAAIADNPEALAFDPRGERIAVISNTAQASILTIVPYHDGRFGRTTRIDLATLGITGTAVTPRGGVTATNVQWHPSGRYLAVNINTQHRVAFFAVTGPRNALVLRPWGNIVMTGRDPFVGRFTPDGRHYLTSDWGRDFGAKNLAERLPNRSSTVTVIRLADADSAEHRVIDSAKSGISAEGVAVSPDGRLVATVNMEGSIFPPGSPRFTRNASVSLFAFDSNSGALVKAGDFPFEAVLPEGAVFDATGDHLLVTVFQGHPGSVASIGAGVHLFRVLKGARPALISRGRIALPHGVHHVAVAGLVNGHQ